MHVLYNNNNNNISNSNINDNNINDSIIINNRNRATTTAIPATKTAIATMTKTSLYCSVFMNY